MVVKNVERTTCEQITKVMNRFVDFKQLTILRYLQNVCFLNYSLLIQAVAFYHMDQEKELKMQIGLDDPKDQAFKTAYIRSSDKSVVLSSLVRNLIIIKRSRRKQPQIL